MRPEEEVLSVQRICINSRIKAIGQHGPGVNSDIELNPEALTIADALDRDRRTRRPRRPLHGIPVLIKDNIATHDRMQTAAGAGAGAEAAREVL